MEPRRTSPLKSLVDRILAMASGRAAVRPVLLVGAIGEGKTSAGLRLLSLLRQSGVRVGGFLAPRVLKGDETVGYSLIDLATNTTHPFAGLEPNDVPVGRFFVSQQALAMADRAATIAATGAQVVFLDEVGRLELGGGGHATAVRRILASAAVPVLLVRAGLVDEVQRAFRIERPIVFRARDAHDESAASPAGTRAFWEIVDSLPYPLLVTLGEDGYPWSRPMHVVDRNANRLWFATSRASRKVRQIEKDPRVTVLFVDSARFNYAAIHGEACVVADSDRGRTLWRDEWRDDWPDGPGDPDYVLLRVDGIRGHYLRGTTGETGTVDLAAPEAA